MLTDHSLRGPAASCTQIPDYCACVYTYIWVRFGTVYNIILSTLSTINNPNTVRVSELMRFRQQKTKKKCTPSQSLIIWYYNINSVPNVQTLWFLKLFFFVPWPRLDSYFMDSISVHGSCLCILCII